MSNRKNLVYYEVKGTNYYNEPYIKYGSIEYDKFVNVQNLISDINDLHYWCKQPQYCGLYKWEDVGNNEIMSIIHEMLSDIFIEIEKITVSKNTKILNFKFL